MRSIRVIIISYCMLSVLGVGTLLAVVTWLYLSGAPNDGSVLPGLVQRWLLFGILAMILAALAGISIARRATAPVKSLSNQLARSRPYDAQFQVQLKERDLEYCELVARVNALVQTCTRTSEQLTNLSAKIAHELRTPITLLQMQIDFAGSKLDPELAESVRTQIKRLSDYVDTALLVARAEKGNVPVNKERLEITQLISDLLKPYELRAQSHRRTLTRRLVSKMAADIDPKIVGLIINNLVSNAFFHGFGEIRVQLRDEGKRTSLSIVNQVRDGASPGNLEGGTGLGLEMVRTLANAHGDLLVKTRKFNRSYAAMVRFVRST